MTRSILVSVGLLCAMASFIGGCDGVIAIDTAPETGALDVSVEGRTVTKLRVNGDEIAVLEQQLNSIFQDGPRRSLVFVESTGQPVQPYTTPAGWSLVDFAVHPSGDLSLVLTTSKDVRYVRLNHNGAVRSDRILEDTVAATDPFFNYAGGLKDDQALQPPLMHDAVRVAALAEDLLLVLRSGRNAIVAYRFDVDPAGGYRQEWRTLVEPGASVLGEGIFVGSFDVFGQLENHVKVSIDVDADGVLAVGVVQDPESNFTFRAHAEYFNEPISATAGVLVTRVATVDGRRLGSTVVDTHQLAELQGLRATSQGFAIVGRVLSQVRSDGTGWDAFAATVMHNGHLGSYHTIDVDRGDVLFDIAQLRSGRYLALGTTGYVQNPSGASISESAQPLLALLDSEGALMQRLSFAGGPRHNQLTTLDRYRGGWLLGGMVNGPGTHSGDSDPTLIVSDGFVRERDDLPD